MVSVDRRGRYYFPVNERDHDYARRLLEDPEAFEKEVQVYVRAYAIFFEDLLDLNVI